MTYVPSRGGGDEALEPGRTCFRSERVTGSSVSMFGCRGSEEY